jgi:HSP20 family protein
MHVMTRRGIPIAWTSAKLFQPESKLYTNMSLIRYHAPELATWPSFSHWANLRDEINDLFGLSLESNLGSQAQLFSGWTPTLDLYQNDDNVVAVVELPGLRKEDIQISLHDGMLSISGERAGELNNGEKSERSERLFGRFLRTVALPTRVEAGKVKATYKDGILTVTPPKAEEAKPRKIQVTVD